VSLGRTPDGNPAFAALVTRSTVKNDKRTIFGWAMYDWPIRSTPPRSEARCPALFADKIVPEGGYEMFGATFSGEALTASA
jgi:hypothetical protein